LKGNIQIFMRLIHTVRHLRPVQVYGRLWYRLYRPRSDERPPPAIRSMTGSASSYCADRLSLLGPEHFRFLNQDHAGSRPEDWNAADRDELWLYNLHYFDDLNADGAEGRSEWHRELIARWIDENPPGTGNGWESYPLSLRIVNWIKWGLRGNEFDAAWERKRCQEPN